MLLKTLILTITKLNLIEIIKTYHKNEEEYQTNNNETNLLNIVKHLLVEEYLQRQKNIYIKTMMEKEIDNISEEDMINEINTEKNDVIEIIYLTRIQSYLLYVFFLFTHYYYSNLTLTIFYTLIILLLIYRDDILDFIYSIYDLE